MNKTMKKLLSFCMSLAMLIGSAVTFTVNVQYLVISTLNLFFMM